MRRGSTSRAVNDINLRIATICGGVAAAIMIGATLATRFSFPPLAANRPAQPTPAVQSGVLSVAQSQPVDRYSRLIQGQPLVPPAAANPAGQSVRAQPANATNPAVATTQPPPAPAPAIAPQSVSPPIPGRW